jgi:hypothetical protein
MMPVLASVGPTKIYRGEVVGGAEDILRNLQAHCNDSVRGEECREA